MTYATAGAGHRRAAEAIAEVLRGRCPEVEVRCVDVLAYAPAWFRAGYGWSYLLLVRHLSWLWKISYRVLDHRVIYRCVRPLRERWNLFIVRRFVAELRRQPPDAVVATHFLPTNVCAAGKRAGWFRGALIVVVTDFYPHRFWVAREAEATVVGTEHSAAILARRGVSGDRIHVLGIPIAGAFASPVDPAAVRARLDLAPGRLTVLVTSGGTTVGHFERVVHALLGLETDHPGRVQLLVVCGEDGRARDRLSQRAAGSPMPLRVFGFVNDMADLMAASDVIVAKAGGLTVSEALARGLPLILYHVIPGQERMNAQYVSDRGAAIVARSSHDVARALTHCLADAERTGAMRRAAASLGRPRAADAIVSNVITPLLQRE